MAEAHIVSSESIRLTPEEICAIAGGLTQPRRQLAELHRQGFWRARLGRDHQVVLERAHYQAVCAGALPAGHERKDTVRPQLQPVSIARR